jgi:ABC-type multidrug transport system fused ATPase/permease subunit
MAEYFRRGYSMIKDPSSRESLEVVKRLWTFIKPYSFLVFITIVSSIISALCNVWQINVVKKMVDGTLAGESNKLISLVVEVGVITVLWVSTKYMSRYASGKYGNNAMLDIKKSFSKRMEKMPVNEIEKRHSGDIVSRFTNDIQTAEGFITNDFINLIYIPFLFLCAFGFMFVANWKLLFASFCITPISAYLFNKISSPIKQYSKQYHEQLGSANSVVMDTTAGMGILKAFNLQKPLFQKYDKALLEALKMALKMEKQRAYMLPVIIVTQELPYIICVVYGGYLAINGEISIGSIIAFTQLLRYLIDPCVMLPQLLGNMKSAIGAASRIFEVMDLPTERVDGEAFDKTDELALEFDNVTFEYDASKSVLDGLSFKLPKGKTIAIVGPSGGGKSTIINLLCGFYELTKGNIRYFGKDMNQWKLGALRDTVALVSQDTYLFPDSIEANIRYGKPEATTQEIIAAAKAANAHEFIMETEKGYDTLVGERGTKLSGGQKQRLAIARAILKDAKILLLDEPTSALDNHSEALVQEAIDTVSKDRSVLIIAHRLSTIKQADIVYVLDNGHMIESGTHDELIEKEGLYKQLYLKQFVSQQDSPLNLEREGA